MIICVFTSEITATPLKFIESLTDIVNWSPVLYYPLSVHDDVQLCQWLRTEDGRLKLGDFNRAEVMAYNAEKKSIVGTETVGVMEMYVL